MQNIQQEIRPPYQIYTGRDYFYLSCTLSHLKSHQYLRIERSTCKIQTLTDDQFFGSEITKTKPFEVMLLIGILILNSQIYLLWVSSATIVFNFSERNDWIYQVENVVHLPFRPAIDYRNSKNKKTNQEVLKYLEETMLKKNFYFRYRSDITLSLENTLLYKKPTEPKFFWNQHLVRIFKQNSAHKCWRIPIMQGFIKCQQFDKFNNQSKSINKLNEFYYLMISRRSKVFSGPKLLNRGLNQKDGQNVANFVETEQIYKIGTDTFSYVSVRGSAPVYWKQTKGFIECKNDQKNPIGFHSHLNSLQQAYPEKRIYFVSWLMKQQLMLKEKIDACFYHSKHQYHHNDKYRMISIDIDEKDKNALYYLKQLIHKQVNLQLPYKDNFFWFTQSTNSKTQPLIMGKQKFQNHRLYRVNCLDCTMRTNAVMTELSRKTMRDIENILSIKKDSKQNYQGLEDIVIDKWKELGSRVSRLYCGQEELEVGRKQQGGFFSMFTLNKDSMGPQFRQNSLQLFFNQVTPKQVVWIQKNLQRKLDITQHSVLSNLKTFILTWNCNNLNPLSINQWGKQALFNFNRGKIDIVVVSLQQMVQLSTYNVLVTIDQQIKNKWKQLILSTLNQKILAQDQKFSFVAEQNLVAITTWVFIKTHVKTKHLQGKQSTLVKTGFAGGLGGNKGGVIIFLKLDSTWIGLVNCHLAAGDGKKIERKQSLEMILYSCLQDRWKQRISECQIIFLIGDLNFRLEWQQKQIKGIVYQVEKKFNKQSLKIGTTTVGNQKQMKAVQQSLKILWQKDQLIGLRKQSGDQILYRFKQLPLTFMPTYKFVKKSHVNQYDDKRSPAWCDRILYQQKIQNTVKQLNYQDIDILFSDHKPVSALFDIRINKINSKEAYIKRFADLQKIYYQQKISEITVTKQTKHQEKHQTKSHLLRDNNISFFGEKNDLIDLEYINSSNPYNVSINPSKKISPSKNQNLLMIPQQKQKRQASPIKNDFSQFHQIAAQIQRKKTSSQNLIDFA